MAQSCVLVKTPRKVTGWIPTFGKGGSFSQCPMDLSSSVEDRTDYSPYYIFLEVLEYTTYWNVITKGMRRDYSPSPLTSSTSQVGMIPGRVDSCHIMKYHSFYPRPPLTIPDDS